MKTNKAFIFGLAALTLAGVASATPPPATVVRITGSSAFRGSTHNAIGNILVPGYTFGFTGSSLGSASQAIFIGTTMSGNVPVIIKTAFSGSVGGYQSVNDGLSVNFLADSATTSAGAGTSGLPSGVASEVPLIALSDVYTSSVTIPVGNLTEAADSPVGVVPFKWIASTGAPAGLANMTPQIAQALFPTGSTTLASFTGLAGDLGISVFAIGRDFDSGTRLTALAETGVGTSLPVLQYQPTFSGSTVASHAYWSPYNLLGLSVIAGNGGYSSGGSLADAMRYTTNAIGGYYVTYLSLGDSNRALTGAGSTGAGVGNAKELSYNGVTFSPDAVRNGQYTFWGYEHLAFKTSAPDDVKAVAQSLATQIKVVDASTSGILLSTMNVSRGSDGGTVGQ